jgi:hypothetical protein
MPATAGTPTTAEKPQSVPTTARTPSNSRGTRDVRNTISRKDVNSRRGGKSRNSSHTRDLSHKQKELQQHQAERKLKNQGMRTTAEPQNGGNNSTMDVNKTKGRQQLQGSQQSSKIKNANGSNNIANRTAEAKEASRSATSAGTIATAEMLAAVGTLKSRVASMSPIVLKKIFGASSGLAEHLSEEPSSVI